MVLRVVLLVCINLLTACSSLATNTPDYAIIEELSLPDELKETSGLYCSEVGTAYTVNDSGNKPVIYKLDAKGKVIDKQLINMKNRDWEALTGDRTHFYIGDIGNNSGRRKFVQVHGVAKNDKKDKADVTSTRIFYINNSVKRNEYLNHDFDAEALINLGDSLFLFSKSWNTGTLFIYELNKTEPKQFIEHTSQIEGLPGIITGGDYDKKNNRFILVGYELKGMGSFYPFITILNQDLSLRKHFELPDYGQVEGLCVTPSGEVWFTQEGSFFSQNKLVKLTVAE